MKFMVVVVALATIVFAEEPAPTKEKRGILGGLGYGSYNLGQGSYSLGHGGLALGGLGLGHGVALTSAPLVSHASIAAPISLGHGLDYGLGGLGGLSLGGLSAGPLLTAPVVSKAIATPIYSKTISPIGPIGPVVTSPIVTKAIATPIFAKTIAAPAISYGHGLSLGYSGLGLGYH